TTLQYLILHQLPLTHPLTPTQIPHSQHISLPNLTTQLKKLHQKHFIDTQQHPHHKPKHLINLSHKAPPSINQPFQHIQALLLHTLSSSHIQQIHHILQALPLLNQTIFKKQPKKPSPIPSSKPY
ncbi:helix-turn-helix domain-containing protein, partial [Bacillus pumilus]|uniref:MarR family transcriptional regulator n=1 Tax=Bacillus pumilus TaxID=1408 RepID=UPI001C92C6A2